MPTYHPGPRFEMTTAYGGWQDPVSNSARQHTGNTYRAEAGTLVPAAADGVVVSSGWHKDFGNHVVLQHTFNNQKAYTLYGSLDGAMPEVGAQISLGAALGTVGNSSTGAAPQLLFQVYGDAENFNYSLPALNPENANQFPTRAQADIGASEYVEHGGAGSGSLQGAAGMPGERMAQLALSAAQPAKVIGLVFDVQPSYYSSVFNTSSLLEGSRVEFDLDGDGNKELTPWIGAGNNWLVYDRNQNDVIDSGRELFGAYTLLKNGSPAGNGMLALQELDTTKDGKLTSADVDFNKLQRWYDRNGDGVSQPSELGKVGDWIRSIDLSAQKTNVTLANGNSMAQIGGVEDFYFSASTYGMLQGLSMQDAQLQQTYRHQFTDSISLSEQARSLPNLHGSGMVRDLNQAVSLSPELGNLLTSYLQQSTRADEIAMLDNLVEKWADTSSMSSLRAQAQSLSANGVTLTYQLDGMTAGSDAANAFLRKLGVLERFMGFTYAGPEGEMRLTPLDANAGLLNVHLSAAQIKNIEEAYTLLKSDVHEGLFSAGRMHTYLDLIRSDMVDGKLKHDFSAMEQALSDALHFNPREAALDVTELVSVLGVQNPLLGWDGKSFLAQQLSSVPALEPGRQIFSAWDMSFVAQKENQSINGNYLSEILMGNDAAGYINGGAGDDMLYGLGGDDNLQGGAGNDWLDGGRGNDNMNGGSGHNQYLFYRGAGRDTIVSGNQPDSSQTVRMANDIKASDLRFFQVDDSSLRMVLKDSGDSLTISSFFFDNVNSQFKIVAGDGHVFGLQEIYALALQETSTGKDRLFGSSADDTLAGLAGNDMLDGKAGNDQISGDEGNDSLLGGEGNDSLHGGAGDDDLSGGDGADVLQGGGGKDVLRGEKGSDTYLVSKDWGTLTIQNVDVDGFGVNPDGIVFTDLASTDASFTRNDNTLLVTSMTGNDVLRVENFFTDDKRAAVENFIFADKQKWTFEDVRLKVLQTSAGADYVVGYETAQNMDGGGGDDSLHGLAGNDTLSGGSGNDSLYSGDGDDVLSGGAGDDALLGGPGADIFKFGIGYGQDSIFIIGNTEDAVNDVIQLEAGISSADVTMSNFNGGILLQLKTGDILTASGALGAPPPVISGLRYADNSFISWQDMLKQALLPSNERSALPGTNFADNISGQQENDGIYAYGGNDIVQGNLGNDTIDGGAGNDTLYGGAGNDRITGELDQNYGVAERNDLIDGGAGNDTLYGNWGDDTLDGGAGDDSLVGGDGNDVYLFGLGSGRDYVDNYGGGTDTIQLGVGVTPANLLIYKSYDTLIFGINGATDTLRTKFYDSFFGNVLGEAIKQLKFADGTVWDQAAIQSHIQAYPDAQSQTGTNAADTILGGAGNDVLNGQDGADVLQGKAGNDYLYGGAGNDVFVYELGDGDDYIAADDSAQGRVDELRLGAGIAPADVRLSMQDGSNALLSLNNGARINLDMYFSSGEAAVQRIRFADNTVWDSATIKTKLMQASETDDVIFGTDIADNLNGMAGSDRINGKNGADTLAGGAGADSLNGGEGNDLLDGGSGHDVLSGGDGNDSLQGQSGDDQLIGEAGNDTIEGGSGRDTLIGHDGADVLRGGYGDDSLLGGLGDDVYVYELNEGKDTIDNLGASNADVDTLRLGAGISTGDVLLKRDGFDFLLQIKNSDGLVLVKDYFSGADGAQAIQKIQFADNTVWDKAGIAAKLNADKWQNENLTGLRYSSNQLSGLGGNDSISGGDMADTLDGGDGNDTMFGAGGQDKLLGGAGADYLWGGDDSDTLDGGAGNDTMQGGVGQDIYMFNIGSGDDYIQSNGYDILQFGPGITPADITLTDLFSSNLVLQLNNSKDRVAVSGYNNHYGQFEVRFADSTVWNLKAIGDMLTQAKTKQIGGPGNDNLMAIDTPSLLQGGAGDDTLRGGSANDTLQGGAGFDSLNGGSGNDELIGGDNNDWLDGYYGNDLLQGGEGSDTMTGFVGNDTFIGGPGDDWLSDYSGNNVYIFGHGDGVDYVSPASIDGAQDTVQFKADVKPEDLVLRMVNNDLLIQYRDSADQIKVTSFFGDWYNVSLRFDDGQIWNRAQVQSKLIDNDPNYGDNLRYGDGANNSLDGGVGNDTLNGAAGDDSLIAGPGSDWLDGGAGNDVAIFSGKLADYQLAGRDNVIRVSAKGETDHLTRIEQLQFADRTLAVRVGTEQNDTLQVVSNQFMLGGAGDDKALFSGKHGDYSFNYSNGVITATNANGVSYLNSIESLQFTDRNITMVDGLRYLASNVDLLQLYKTDVNAALTHYLNTGALENRSATFDAAVYVNKYADVRAAVGGDMQAATLHFINTGFGQGRSDSKTSADTLYGTAGADSILAYGGNDTLWGGMSNDVLDGGDGADIVLYEGKSTEYLFSVKAGVISVGDLNGDNGNEGADIVRNVETLRFADRDMSATTLTALRYVASHADLIGAFGVNTDNALSHYLNSSVKEKRAVTFEPQVYIDKYADVRAAVGSDLEAATRHFITTGFGLGRSDSKLSADNLSGADGNDSVLSYGGNDTLYGGLGNDVLDGGDGVDIVRYDGKQGEYLYSVKAGVISVTDNNGANGNEGVDAVRNVETLRFADRDMNVSTLHTLRYVASYADLIGAFGVNADKGMEHYLNTAKSENRPATFDPQVYIDKYADVRAAVGSDLEAATRHFISTGFGQGRNDSKLSADNLSGTSGNDSMLSYGGNDTLYGGLGNDVLEGGDGVDIARYDGKQSEYLYSVKAGVISVTDNNGANGNEGVDALRNIETLRFSDRDMSVTTLNALRYVASHADLIGAFGVNTDSATAHYLNSSVKENRGVTFDAQTYIDKYADVRAAVGGDLEAATRHFITTGFGQGRNDSKLSADNLSGTTGNDSVLSYGGNDTLWGGLGNDVVDGGDGTDIARYDGKQGEYLYSVKAGVISITDNNGANGNEGVDTLRNIETLRFSDRDMSVTTLNALRYVASHADLIGAFGVNTDSATAHYLNSSVKENRGVTFDAQVYIDKYADVRAAVGGDLEAATRHFISTGFGQGRNDSKLSADNLSGTSGNDSVLSYGGNDTLWGGLGNDVLDGGDGADIARYDGKQGEYLYSVKAGVISISDNNGANGNEGVDALRNMETLRFIDRDMNVTTLNALRYVASHADLIGAFGVNTDNGMAHYLNSSVKENRGVTFDPQTYIDKYADVRAAVGGDLEAATLHFISTGFGQGRNDSKLSADNLSGTSGNDSVLSFGGNDTLYGGLGNDVLDGGDGADIARYDGKQGEYLYSVKAGVISISDNNGANGNEGVDALRNMETLRFADRDMSVTTLNVLRYVASHADLIGAFGVNTDNGMAHYLNSSVKENRAVVFDPQTYIDKYADVRAAVGSDLEAATRHFISTGFGQGRSDNKFSADNLTGTSGNDSVLSYGGNDTLWGGLGNDVLDGGDGTDIARYDGKQGEYLYSVKSGVISITDNNGANGNEGVDSLRNIETLRFADRDMSATSLQGLRYIASHADLIGAFGVNADSGLTHYLNNAVREGRGVTFDPDIYLAKYADVRSAHGVDQEAATKHFISTGFAAGRNLNLNGNDVLGGSALADTLDGGVGNDTITGAGGADIFRFNAASGQDVLTDFNRAQGDKIWLKSNLNSSGIVNAADVLSRASGVTNAVIDLGGGHTITLTGVAAGSLIASDFVIF
ncbi:calcium-binding protein [Massilia sp. W12]|uniref:calcium-binding protein n=1 Tax=Massilia sp. W12 TaxID=3126507 RepID=UPI0030D3740E